MNPLISLVAGIAWLAAPGPLAAQDARRVEVSGPGSQQVLVVEAPAVTGDSYAITGQVSYEGVAGDGYLEMWSVFPDGSRYFSRTLDVSGPLGKLSGTSPERAFALPFFLTPDGPRPARLEVNVVLPAAGRVVVSGLRFEPDASAAGTKGAWWSAQTGGWIGGVAGSVMGVIGAAIGTLASLGRGRRLVLAGLVALGVSGLLLLTVGAVALALGQPYEVWYPLLLMGVIDSVVPFSLLPSVRRRFEELELRRMRSLDARA
jgi:hypothetical protein